MMTYSQLAALHRALSSRRVLSVYLDGSASDPAKQRSWRVQLDQQLVDASRRLEAGSPAERSELAQAVRLLDGAVANLTAGIGAPGWAAFITADRIHDAQALPAPVPTRAVWGKGASVAPYLRALREERAVVVIVSDARHADIHHLHPGRPPVVEVIRAHHVVDQPEHMGSPPRQGFHTGTRGSAGRDAAQRSLLQGRQRMILEVADRVHALAGTDGWIIVGGIKRVAVRLVRLLEPLAPDRVTHVESLDVHASEATIARLARSCAAELRDRLDERRIVELADLAGAHGLGAVGLEETRQALEQSSVRDLYLTPRFLRDHASDAEEAVRAALDQDAVVEEVAGRAADRLDGLGGIMTGLRFRPAFTEASMANG